MFRRSGYRFADKNMRHSTIPRACPDSEGAGHALASAVRISRRSSGTGVRRCAGMTEAVFPSRADICAPARVAAATLSPLRDLSYGVADALLRKTPPRRAMAAGKTKQAAKPAARRDGNGKSAEAVPAFDKEQELKALRNMLLIRRFEEKAGQMYGMGLIGGFCHLYSGQEAVVVGMQMTLKPGDEVITGYRDHGHMLACGMDPKGVMAELTGRRHGYSKGKGGSMHMFSIEKDFYGGHGIVAAPVPIGTGLGFAHRYRD